VKGTIALSEYLFKRLTNEWRNAILLRPRGDALKKTRHRTARFDREIREGQWSPIDVSASDLRNDLQKKKYVMLLRSEKQTDEWIDAFKRAYAEMESEKSEREREEEEREREGREGNVAFTVASQVGVEQAKLIDLKSRMEGFAKVLGTSFFQVRERERERRDIFSFFTSFFIFFHFFDLFCFSNEKKCLAEGEVKVSDYKGGVGQKSRTLIIFEDVLIIAKDNKRAKTAKNSLIALKKIQIADVTALITPINPSDPHFDASLCYLVLNPRGDDPLLFRVETELAMLFSQALIQVFFSIFFDLDFFLFYLFKGKAVVHNSLLKKE